MIKQRGKINREQDETKPEYELVSSGAMSGGCLLCGIRNKKTGEYCGKVYI